MRRGAGTLKITALIFVVSLQCSFFHPATTNFANTWLLRFTGGLPYGRMPAVSPVFSYSDFDATRTFSAARQ
jgi:hypothetical protein